MIKNTKSRNNFERVREKHRAHRHETIQRWAVPVPAMPQVNQGTANKDKYKYSSIQNELCEERKEKKGQASAFINLMQKVNRR